MLAPNFVCVANIEASDGGAAIIDGNRRVLAARLSDAKFFWEQDLKVPLEERAKKLDQIVFHEKLGTVADKVERVAKLARWLVEENIVVPAKAGTPGREVADASPAQPATNTAANPAGAPASAGATELADLAERAARLAKADLVTAMVGEFPELQGVIGGHLARAQGEDPQVADAIRDHYKPAGQGDEVPTAPVTVAVSLADKLDTVAAFFSRDLTPTGSKDPFALRRAATGAISIVLENDLRFSLRVPLAFTLITELSPVMASLVTALRTGVDKAFDFLESMDDPEVADEREKIAAKRAARDEAYVRVEPLSEERLAVAAGIVPFFADRLKVQQREAGVRHDLIDAVFALGGEDDLVRLLARVKALQAFVETPEGADLLAGYKRAANILKKEGWTGAVVPAKAGTPGGEGLRADGTPPATEAAVNPPEDPASAGVTEQSANKTLSYTPEKEEAALIAAVDSAEPRARAAVEAEDFEGAMAALASLRAPVDAFFDKVTVNDPDPAKREARLVLLARMRDAVQQVADFSRIEG